MDNSAKKLVLISNDDGVHARGLYHLIDCVIATGLDCDIIAVAPDSHCSGQSSAITVDKTLRITPHPDYHGAHVYSVNGTPVDCVKLGLHAILPRRPDFMLSGINHGSNSGCSVIYSGTMGAAMEACMSKIPAVGFSLLSHDPQADFSGSDSLIIRIIRHVAVNGLPDGICLNVNFPKDCVPKGLKVTKSAPGRWTEEYHSYVDPHGRTFYMLTGRYIDDEPDNPATDNYWLARQWATAVPVRPDQTMADAMPQLAAALESPA